MCLEKWDVDQYIVCKDNTSAFKQKHYINQGSPIILLLYKNVMCHAPSLASGKLWG